jgi:hypothetical protein
VLGWTENVPGGVTSAGPVGGEGS